MLHIFPFGSIIGKVYNERLYGGKRMKIDQAYFDAVIDRAGTACEKWDGRKEVFGREDVIPLWVADMDFACSPAIVEALKARAAHPIYG